MLARVALALLLVASAGLTAPTPVAGTNLSRFEPDPTAEGAPALEGLTWVASGTGWTAWLRPVEDVERQNFIQNTTGLRIDPFAAGPERPGRYITWLLVIRNDGDGALEFNPAACWLKPNREAEMQTPIGFDGLSFDYRVVGSELPESYAAVRPAVFEHPRPILPGTSSTGLLVYRHLGPKIRRFTLEVPLTLSTGYGEAFTAHYRAIKPDKKKKRKP